MLCPSERQQPQGLWPLRLGDSDVFGLIVRAPISDHVF